MNYEKQSVMGKVFDIGNVIFMLLLCVIMVYPMMYEGFISFSEPAKLFGQDQLLLKSQGFTWDNYKQVFENNQIVTGLKNTMVLMTVGLALNMVMTMLASYFLTRRKALLFKPFMIMILITMFFGGGLIPTYVNIMKLGLINKLWALILPSALNTGNAIMLSSFFRTIPSSLVESVELDGGGHITILFRIFAPLSKAALAVILLYYGVGIWNSWFDANIYISDANKFPLQLVLQKMLIEDSLRAEQNMFFEENTETMKAATVMVVTVPILVLYPFLQKYFVQGVMIGSLKE